MAAADVHVREAVVDDAPQILAVSKEVASEREFILTQPEDLWDLPRQRERLANPNLKFFIAERAGQIVGIVSLRRGERTASRQTVDLGISIRKDSRGAGIGRRLCTVAEEWAKANGVHKICLGVFPENERARRLYRSLGYVEEGHLREQFFLGGKWRDEILMAKWLRD
ncbi:MAG: GNAT family N-acetyltransferase [Thermoplasmatota archaeon]